MLKRPNISNDPKDLSTDLSDEDTVVVLIPSASPAAAKPLLPPDKRAKKFIDRGYTKDYIKELIMGGLLRELSELLDPLTDKVDAKDRQDLEATISSHTTISQYSSAVLSLVTTERASKPALASEKIIDIAIEYFNCLTQEPNIVTLLSKESPSKEAIQILYSNRSLPVKLMLALFYYPSKSEQYDTVCEILFDDLLTAEKLGKSFTDTKENFLALEKYLKTQLNEGRTKKLLEHCAALMQLSDVKKIITTLNNCKDKFLTDKLKSKIKPTTSLTTQITPTPTAAAAAAPMVAAQSPVRPVAVSTPMVVAVPKIRPAAASTSMVVAAPEVRPAAVSSAPQVVAASSMIHPAVPMAVALPVSMGVAEAAVRPVSAFATVPSSTPPTPQTPPSASSLTPQQSCVNGVSAGGPGPLSPQSTPTLVPGPMPAHTPASSSAAATKPPPKKSYKTVKFQNLEAQCAKQSEEIERLRQSCAAQAKQIEVLSQVVADYQKQGRGMFAPPPSTQLPGILSSSYPNPTGSQLHPLRAALVISQPVPPTPTPTYNYPRHQAPTPFWTEAPVNHPHPPSSVPSWDALPALNHLPLPPSSK